MNKMTYFRAFVNKTLYNIKSKKMFVDSRELIFPVNGNITGIQYIVISRMIDIENYFLMNDNSFKWERKLTLLNDKNVTKYSLEMNCNNFCFLLNSLENNGFIEGKGTISVSSSPVVLTDGTHRLAYILYKELNGKWTKNELEVVVRPGFPNYPENGKLWLTSIGMSREDIETLDKYYHKNFNEQYIICMIYNLEFENMMMKALDRVGCAYENKGHIINSEKNTHRNSNLRELSIKSGKNLYKWGGIGLTYIYLDEQELHFKNHRFKSSKTDELMKQLKKHNMLVENFYLAEELHTSRYIQKWINCSENLF